MKPLAWVLNLDADHELRQPLGYNAPKRVLERVSTMRERIVGLLGPDDVVLGRDDVSPSHEGRCWCPTPTALKLLARASVAPPLAPPFEVVRRVNHRRFSLALGVTLPGSRWIEDENALRTAVASGSPSGRWVMKRPYSSAGNGRRLIGGSAWEAHDAPWVKASLAVDGLVLEPWVDKAGELAIHGYVDRDGAATLGRVCVQVVDAHGAWVETVPDASAVTETERATLLTTAEEVADALRTEGYFGPFGVDAFRFVDGDSVHLNRRSEINARYTMGWAVGMGDLRPDREG